MNEFATLFICIHQVKLIKRRYHLLWKQRLLFEKIPVDPIIRLVSECFSAFSAQFRQISRLPNVLFRLSHNLSRQDSFFYIL